MPAVRLPRAEPHRRLHQQACRPHPAVTPAPRARPDPALPPRAGDASIRRAQARRLRLAVAQPSGAAQHGETRGDAAHPRRRQRPGGSRGAPPAGPWPKMPRRCRSRGRTGSTARTAGSERERREDWAATHEISI
ncbi:hypothetical protein C2845_PM14G08610 [Panicum miliaceum]|uniref:Uncharacterized protein n=1 Tax=Panicum miliaceum TaxID=4540 RepID=A0A3L6PPB5_PANMI|nr:hypothetical protein C2845_PM14G08610 [Panicum miliaceum]